MSVFYNSAQFLFVYIIIIIVYFIIISILSVLLWYNIVMVLHFCFCIWPTLKNTITP